MTPPSIKITRFDDSRALFGIPLCTTEVFYPSAIQPEQCTSFTWDSGFRIFGSYQGRTCPDNTPAILFDDNRLEFKFGDIKITNENMPLETFIDKIWPYVRYYWEVKSLDTL